jgi:hypothetical protein
MMSTGPCGWTPEALCDTDLDKVTDEDISTAIFILWSMTGQRFGACLVTASPIPACKCRRAGCSSDCTLYLPGPVSDVETVLVDGEVYTDWVRVGDTLRSPRPWRADVEVTYYQGLPVPSGGERAILLLAREVAKGRCEDETCTLPQNLVRRTLQGDTQEFEPIEAGRTNITFVDMWVDAVNATVDLPAFTSPDVEPLIVEQVGS